ncbi:hypothetical protein ACM6Q7_08240 [Peribacillus butanolivorans]
MEHFQEGGQWEYWLSLSENGYIKKIKFMIIIKAEDLNIKMENIEKD